MFNLKVSILASVTLDSGRTVQVLHEQKFGRGRIVLKSLPPLGQGRPFDFSLVPVSIKALRAALDRVDDDGLLRPAGPSPAAVPEPDASEAEAGPVVRRAPRNGRAQP